MDQLNKHINQKLKWMRSLKVGDLVCDCRYLHKKIINISERKMVWYPRIVRMIMFHQHMPDKISDFFDDVWDFTFRFLGITEVVDKDLTLEGGSCCSAMHCCDDADHEWEHPINDSINVK